jgi:restriction system protein
VTGDELAKVIISRLFNLDPEKFERFVTHLLTLVGFEAATTQFVSDGGVDVIGTLNPEGLANITLKAQVKRRGGHVGNQDVLMLRGTLGVDEHGVLITTGGFTKQAQTEAEAEGKRPIAPIDGGILVDLILTHYDELDEEYKELLQLRKREVSLRERFYTVEGI